MDFFNFNNFFRKKADTQKQQIVDFDYVAEPSSSVLKYMESVETGLSEEEAEKRLKEYGHNEPAKKKKRAVISQFGSMFFSPLVIVLLIIGIFSLFFGEKISAILVFAMAIISVLLSFFQELKAGREVEKLIEMVRTMATVIRDGQGREISIRELVPGDIVDLFAGDMIPADLRIITGKDLFVNQSSLTGEAFPVEKFPESNKTVHASVGELSNIAFMGSSVVSGTAKGVVIKTGRYTQFGELAKKLATIRIETNFDKGVRKFVWLMIRFMLVMITVIFGITAIFKVNIIDAFMFALSVAVGLTPEMLPMIVTLNLSKGAMAMSKRMVIVKQLNSIQNLGAMDILCTDKTGTLTIDQIVLEKHYDVASKEDSDVLKYAFINSNYQTGLKNILDKAILKYTEEHNEIPKDLIKKVDEIPFDFSRKIMSVVIAYDGERKLVCKGAPEEIYKRCTKYELDGEMNDIDDLIVSDLKEEYDKLSRQGFRVLAIAYKTVDNKKETFSKDDEHDLVLKGYIAFLDPAKPSAREAIKTMEMLGVKCKVLTGDNELVTKKVCNDVGLNIESIANGEMVEKLNDADLEKLVEQTTVFARLSPLQKERVIRALRKNGHTVGYLGDGINDAPALKASDVGISVDNAVDIAKESADIILLKKSLLVLEDGILEGRKTFGNITKYIRMGASSNFGNMFSMTGGCIFLPFLPMLPIQILLNNFLYDMSQVAIPTDRVDKEYLMKPRPWDVKYIKKFMFAFGPISSLFDFMTFGVMLFVFHASPELFHTGWFIESLFTQTFVIHIIRTNKIPFLESKPSGYLLISSILIVAIGIFLPLSPAAKSFGFVSPPPLYFLILVIMTTMYLFMVQFVKNVFVKRYG